MHRLDTVALLHSCFLFSALSRALDHIPNAFALAQACHKTDLHLTFSLSFSLSPSLPLSLSPLLALSFRCLILSLSVFCCVVVSFSVLCCRCCWCCCCCCSFRSNFCYFQLCSLSLVFSCALLRGASRACEPNPVRGFKCGKKPSNRASALMARGSGWQRP